MSIGRKTENLYCHCCLTYYLICHFNHRKLTIASFTDSSGLGFIDFPEAKENNPYVRNPRKDFHFPFSSKVWLFRFVSNQHYQKNLLKTYTIARKGRLRASRLFNVWRSGAEICFPSQAENQSISSSIIRRTPLRLGGCFFGAVGLELSFLVRRVFLLLGLSDSHVFVLFVGRSNLIVQLSSNTLRLVPG